MKTVTQTFAAVLIASAAFGGIAAAAEGEYYEGIFPQQNQLDANPKTVPATRSFGFPSMKLARHERLQVQTPLVGSGDYYEGVSRPD